MNYNFAIPGLQEPSPDKHLARITSLPAGEFLDLGVWFGADLPRIDLLRAAEATEIVQVFQPSRLSVSVVDNVKRLGIWLPDDIDDGDWMFDLVEKTRVRARKLFNIGRAPYWEVPVAVPAPLSETADGTQAADVVDVVWRGDEWTRRLTVSGTDGSPTNLTGYAVWAQLRDSPGGSLLADLAATVTEPLSGYIDLSMSAAVTDNLHEGTAWWDVLMRRPDEVYERTEPVRLIVRTGVTDV